MTPRETHYEFMSLDPLVSAETTFYKVGIEAKEALGILDKQLISLNELARYFVSHIRRVIHNNSKYLFDSDIVRNIELSELCFDDDLKNPLDEGRGEAAPYEWNLDADTLYKNFHEFRYNETETAV
jgi:hypothetical protein